MVRKKIGARSQESGVGRITIESRIFQCNVFLIGLHSASATADSLARGGYEKAKLLGIGLRLVLNWVRFHGCDQRGVHMQFALLDNIRSAYNVGSIFRTADCVGLEGLILTGYSAYPPHIKIEKTSLGAEETVPWIHLPDAGTALAQLRSGQLESPIRSANWNFDALEWQAFPLIAWESGAGGKSMYDTEFPQMAVHVFGNEVSGVQPAFLAACQQIVEIPLYGSKHSLNVASSFAVAMYEVKRVRAKS